MCHCVQLTTSPQDSSCSPSPPLSLQPHLHCLYLIGHSQCPGDPSTLLSMPWRSAHSLGRYLMYLVLRPGVPHCLQNRSGSAKRLLYSVVTTGPPQRVIATAQCLDHPRASL